MLPFIQITRHLYEEPRHLNLVVIAGNGLTRGSLEVYCNSEQLKEIADGISNLPLHDSANYLFELGSERPEDRFSFYFRMRAFATNSLGRCAVQFRFNNNVEPIRGIAYHHRQLSEFTIDMGMKDRETLGRLLTEFADLKHQRLYWSLSKSVVDNKLVNADKRTGDTIEAAFASLPK